MAPGDLTASTPAVVEGLTALKSAIDGLNLAATTDFLYIIPVANMTEAWTVFKVERAA